MASTGSNLEADMAGITPDNKPIKVDKENPKNTLNTDNTNSKSSLNWDNTVIVSQTRKRPTIPPTIANMIDSNKN